MVKPKKSEKIFLEEIFRLGKTVQKKQRGLSVGQLTSLIRKQLQMSQRALAKRAKIQQTTIARIESGLLEPNISTLKKMMEAMDCDLLITIVPRDELKNIRRNQALIKAEHKISYLHGTMSLEKQSPSQKLLSELLEDEVKNLLDSPGSVLWEEE